ncbi:hypothetical protein [Streptomyces indicus]|uniref:Uncharacterized protein n=1 Tax=Streptomyces indicus TaxID=417292 RepID=A0A1G8ZSZ3_9ACTN|nr:hypothetical protein [Streptomyces indicus]SDK17250.1 hypothetical protein SAMN05421806_105128 [Streptomyces indicus]
MAALFPHTIRLNSRFTPAAWRRALVRIIDRLADAPLDQSVVQAAPTRNATAARRGCPPTRSAAPARRGFAKPRARWYTVTGADGRPHLVAEWRRED